MRETNLYSIAFNNKEDAVQLKNKLKEFSIKDINDGHIYNGFLSFDIVEKTDQITAVILTYLKSEEFNHITQECYNYSELLNKNIVKKVCAELGITQAELGRQLDVPASTVGTWASGKIPKMAEVALELMLENKRKDEILKAIKKAQEMIARI